MDVSAALDHSLYDGDNIAVVEREFSAIKSLDFLVMGLRQKVPLLAKTTLQAGVPPSISDYGQGDENVKLIE